jgi:hypothetical protein
LVGRDHQHKGTENGIKAGRYESADANERRMELRPVDMKSPTLMNGVMTGCYGNGISRIATGKV